MLENQEQDRKQEAARISARGDACHAPRLRDKRGRVSKRRLHRLRTRIASDSRRNFRRLSPSWPCFHRVYDDPIFLFLLLRICLHPSLARDRDRVQRRSRIFLSRFLLRVFSHRDAIARQIDREPRSFSNEFFFCSTSFDFHRDWRFFISFFSRKKKVNREQRRFFFRSFSIT